MVKTAEELAKMHKEISVSEFFEKNKHLLGFDNPTKALLMAVKESVDNSLDACQSAGILPDINVKIKSVAEEKYRVLIEDNGPGIVKEQIPKIFGKLLYGSKFHTRVQNRGQQGIGISAVLLYSQLTTGTPFKVWSRTENGEINYYELFIDTMKNEPEIIKNEIVDSGVKEHGTKIQMDLIGRYRKSQSVDDYLRQTYIANPFVKINYIAPDGTKMSFQRSINELPVESKEIKPHPYGVEFGILLRMLVATKSKTLTAFFTNEFSSVGNRTAIEICKVAKIDKNKKPKELSRDEIEKLIRSIQKVRIQRPPLDCLSPIGSKELEKALKKEYPDAEFIAVRAREPEVYRGNPFQIEVGVIYGGDIKQDQFVRTIRSANRVPLLYQAGACATTTAIKDVDWKRYGLQQPNNSLPIGPMLLIIHMCSTWVPFVSESKEAIAPYPEIIKEMKLAMQDAARELGRYLSGKRKASEQQRRLEIFDRYSIEVANSLSILTDKDEKTIHEILKNLISKRISKKGEENV